MKSGNSLGFHSRHLDAMGGVFTQFGGKDALMGRVGTTQLAVASVRSSDDPFKTTTGEKIFFWIFPIAWISTWFPLSCLCSFWIIRTH